MAFISQLGIQPTCNVEREKNTENAAFNRCHKFVPQTILDAGSQISLMEMRAKLLPLQQTLEVCKFCMDKITLGFWVSTFYGNYGNNDNLLLQLSNLNVRNF